MWNTMNMNIDAKQIQSDAKQIQATRGWEIGPDCRSTV